MSQYVSEVAAKFFGQLLTHILFTVMLCCTACRTDITHLEPFTGYVRPDDKQFKGHKLRSFKIVNKVANVKLSRQSFRVGLLKTSSTRL